MIEKLELPSSARLVCGKDYDVAFKYIKQTVNQLVDAVNELQNRIDPPSVYQVMKDKDAIIGKHIGEKQRLQDELERTRKALDYAIDVIQTVAKMSDKLSREYGETLVEQLDNIQAYCWQEGYVLTHEEDLSKALEQKGVK